MAPRMAAAPALARRSPISARRLLKARRSDGPSPLEGTDEGDLVGVLEVAADGQPAGDARHGSDDGLESLGQIHRGRLAFERRVGREDDLLEGLAVASRLIGAPEQLADAQALGTDPID